MKARAILAALLALGCGAGGPAAGSAETSSGTAAVSARDEGALVCGWLSTPIEIGFALSSSEYEPERQHHAEVLEELAALLDVDGVERVRLSGHRSLDCGVEPLAVARARARVVAERLVALGVDGSRVEHAAGPDTRPAPTHPECDPEGSIPHPQRVVTVTVYRCTPRTQPTPTASGEGS